MRTSRFYDPLRNTNDAPVTQKATGVLVLRDVGFGTVPILQLVQRAEDLPARWAILRRHMLRNNTIFARPCPVRPRHGFVDSGVVKDVAAAQALFAKAKEADPQAELLLMEAIKADWSGIYVPGRLVVGPGHDGATSGHASFSIPLLKHFNSDLTHLQMQARVLPYEVPYIEVVAEKRMQHPYYVQVRGGPPLITNGNGTDYVPAAMTIAHVVQAQGDLIEWETAAKEFKPNTAVWHPGGSMASHYAVHCAVNKIPIVISHRPYVGEQLDPTAAKAPLSMDSILRGIGAATALDLCSDTIRRPAVAAMLMGLHNFTAFSGDDGFWLGAASTIMQRLGTVALLGEARHAMVGSGRSPGSRDTIYVEGLRNPFQARRSLHRAQWMFHNFAWSSGYGGKAWAQCGTALLDLDAAIREFVQQPVQKQCDRLVSSLNQAVNQAHNGGWWLNKFCEEELMNQAAQGDPRAAISGLTAIGELHAVADDAINLNVSLWAATRAIHGAEKETVDPVPQPASILNIPPQYKENFGKHLVAEIAEPTPAPLPLCAAQAKPLVTPSGTFYGVHVQYKTSPDKHYSTKDFALSEPEHFENCTKSVVECLKFEPSTSWADDSHTEYGKLVISGDGHTIHLAYCGYKIGTI